jgi:hypothetical protein
MDSNLNPSETPIPYQNAVKDREAATFGSSWRIVPAAAFLGFAKILSSFFACS